MKRFRPFRARIGEERTDTIAAHHRTRLPDTIAGNTGTDSRTAIQTRAGTIKRGMATRLIQFFMKTALRLREKKFNRFGHELANEPSNTIAVHDRTIFTDTAADPNTTEEY